MSSDNDIINNLFSDQNDISSKEESQSKPKSHNKVTTPRNSERGRSKKRKPQKSIDSKDFLETLMEGITYEDNTNTNQPKNSGNNSPRSPRFQFGTQDYLLQSEPMDISSSFTSRVELNIQTYLETCFLNLREDFTSELQNILIETDCIETEVNSFLNDLRRSLRDLLSFELPKSNQIPQIMTAVDSLCPSFMNIMKSIPTVNAEEIEKDNEKANFAKVAINSFSPIMKNTFKSMIDDLSKNLSSLHELQTQNKKDTIKDARQRKQLQNSLYEIEANKVSQEVESQTIKELSSYISELRNIYNHVGEYDDAYDDDVDEMNDGGFREAINQLKKEIESSQIESIARLKSFHRKFKDYREEAAIMRNQILYNNQVIAQRSMQAMSFMPQMDMSTSYMNPPHFQSPMRYPTMGSPPRVSFPGINNELSISGGDFQNRSSELADSVRSRLREIQEQHDTDLENISSFLHNLRKDEKQRIRSAIMNE